MRYFLDTEFYEAGPHAPIQLISLGLVCEDGRELYLENSEVNLDSLSQWLKANVVPHLQGTPDVLGNLSTIRNEILQFVRVPLKESSLEQPQFWGYFADYDWVVFCQIFGAMIDLPRGYPMFCFDLKQWAEQLGVGRGLFPSQEGAAHHALEDARWNMKLYKYLDEYAEMRK